MSETYLTAENSNIYITFKTKDTIIQIAEMDRVIMDPIEAIQAAKLILTHYGVDL